uniref:Uncharacterized protein n=1 Tax=Fagus sylvatica TaxID=28930 RepID=A0A2N9I5M2_FAGSY
MENLVLSCIPYAMMPSKLLGLALFSFFGSSSMQKRYGEQAAQVTNEGFDAAGHAIGGLGLSGGLLGFVFTRNPATLSTGVLFGGALLALNTFSFKIWRQGNSSLPTLSSPSLEELSDPLIGSTSHQQKVLIHCAAMLCFSSYVLISGGNPPPKKLKSSPSVAS